jgi:hypothetical protein
MPSFYGWCDICVDFYPISQDEWEKQLVESAQLALNAERKGKTAPSLQLCPECKKKQNPQARQRDRCKRTASGLRSGRR